MHVVCRIVLLYMFSFLLMGMNSWTSQQNEQFSATISISNTTIVLNQRAQISLDLYFAQDYHPDLVAIKKNLSTSRTLEPFSFFIETINEFSLQDVNDKPLKHLRLEFDIEPRALGKHPITFYTISFVPNAKKSPLPTIEIFTPIFTFIVEAPKTVVSSGEALAPLMDFSSTYPIEMNEKNRKQFMDNPERMEKEEAINRKILSDKNLPITGAFVLLVAFIFVWTFRQAPGNDSNKSDHPGFSS